MSADAQPDERPLESGRDLPVGGQAVLEGVMVRGVSTWAVAVRRPAGDIEVSSEPVVSIAKRHRALRLPVIRGVVALVESMRLGLRALGMSANAQAPEDEHGKREEIGSGTWAGTVTFALLFSVCLFFLLPATLTNLFQDSIPNSIVFVVIEKLVRISVFLAYILLVSRLEDLQRVFQYHGAEHKTISCYEAGLDLTPENAQRSRACTRAAGRASC